jgi:hypothetical protein
MLKERYASEKTKGNRPKEKPCITNIILHASFNSVQAEKTGAGWLSRYSNYAMGPWLRRLAAGLPPRRPGFDPGLVHVRFVVDKVALGQVFLRVLRFSPVNFIPPMLHY